MRTTLTLDDDLAALLKKRATTLDISFREMVNRAIRTGLGVEAQAVREPPKTEPFSSGLRPGIDPDRLNQLVDELETEAFVVDYRGRRP